MEDSDDDFSLSDGDIDEVLIESVPSGVLTRSAQKRRRQCTENVVYSPPKKRTLLPSNLQQISQMKNNISKRLNGRDIDTNLSLRIIKATLEKQETHLRRNQRKKGKTNKPPPVRDFICKLFSISGTTYARIIGGYLNDSRNRIVYYSGRYGKGRSGTTNRRDEKSSS